MAASADQRVPKPEDILSRHVSDRWLWLATNFRYHRCCPWLTRQQYEVGMYGTYIPRYAGFFLCSECITGANEHCEVLTARYESQLSHHRDQCIALPRSEHTLHSAQYSVLRAAYVSRSLSTHPSHPPALLGHPSPNQANSLLVPGG